MAVGVAMLCTLFAAMSAAAAGSHAHASPVDPWKLVSFEDVEQGKTIRRFGDKPLGLFIYTADGHVVIQIAHPGNPACSGAQMQALLEGYVAYWGTHTVDAAAGVVTHHVQSDLSNGYAGTEQRRPFRLEGDRLVIGHGKTWTRILARAR